MRDFRNPRYKVLRDREECIECDLCVRQCANEVHYRDEKTGALRADSMKCVNCQRCTLLCPTRALAITRWPQVDAGSAVWTEGAMDDITAQAQTGGVLLASMGNPKSYHIYWEHLLLNASQVTNPSIDPLREPMETRVVLGSRPSKLRVNERTRTVVSPLPPQLSLDVPIMFSAMSFGSVSLNTQKALAMAARELGTYFNCGEGGLHRDLEPYADRAIVQVASGRFGVDPHYLNAGAAIEIKIGQGAKPGIGGHLPGEKINEEVSRTRMIPEGTDAISPAPHHDIYSIEDLHQLVHSLKEATHYEKPVIVKIAAVHNVAAIASNIAVGFVSDGDVASYLGKTEIALVDSTLLNGYRYIDDEDAATRLRELMGLNVMAVATRRVISVEATTPVDEVCALFASKRIKKVPVVQDGKLVGALSRRNIMRSLVEAIDILEK